MARETKEGVQESRNQETKVAVLEYEDISASPVGSLAVNILPIIAHYATSPSLERE